MVYLWADWGMGDSENRNRNYADKSSCDLLRIDRDQRLDDEVDLHPLSNQVGGHTRLMVLNPQTICKPLNYRELDFYQNIQDQDIKLFVPKYKGVMQATVCSGKMDKRYSPSFSDESHRSKTGYKRKREEVLKMKVHNKGSAKEVLKSNLTSDSTSKQYFLMLENITSRYNHPCILDLKMGTRQHGDDASAEKRSKQMAKCAASTSASLGVRLCGMQVYQAESDTYLKKDKYWGRELNEDGFKSALVRFFNNGFGLRVNIIRKVLAKLEQLRRVIEKQSSYRFYSCSLLIVYEGESALPHIAIPKSSETCCSDSLHPTFCENDCTQESSDNSREVPCCYDADTSNSSADFNLSHDEVSQDFHHRGFGEAAARGAKSGGSFYPISEETVFLDSPPTMATSSPISVDSWVMYSNSSSDEYSLSQFNGGGSSNDDETSDFESCSPKAKPNHSCALQFAELDLEDEDDEELTPTVSHKSATKRVRVRENHLGVPSTSLRRPRSPTTQTAVDVRMIDFAHTSFVSDSTGGGTSSSSGAVHQGPDGGFLTGLDSLKRLLSQILSDG